MKDFYEILGLNRDATSADIKKAYRMKAKKCHPDVCPGDEQAEKNFKELTAAYEVLIDENKRSIYDRYGEDGLKNMGAGGAGFGDFGDIFSDLFDIFGGGFGRAYANERNTNYKRRGSDLRVRINLTFKEAVFGTKKTIKIEREEVCHSCNGKKTKEDSEIHTCDKCRGTGQVQRISTSLFGQVVTYDTCDKCHGSGEIIENPCSNCKGTGREIKNRKINIDIPQGVDDNSYMTLRGEGNAGYNGGSNGDIQVIFTVEPDDTFIRDGYDIFTEIPISYTDAALGNTIVIPTLEGTEDYEIPQGTQTGTVFTLKSKGVKHIHSNHRGDLHFKVNIEVPKKLSKEERELLEKLAELDGEKVRKKKEGFFEKVKDIFD